MRSLFRRAPRFRLLLLTSLVLLAVGFAAYRLTHHATPTADSGTPNESKTATPPPGGTEPASPAFPESLLRKYANRPLNILVMGTDEGGWRTDILFLVHWEPQYPVLTIVSLPRDSEVPIPCPVDLSSCISPDKLGHAHAYGRVKNQGAELTVKTVEQFLGVKIDYYADVDYNGFIHVIDAIGGIKVNVELPIEFQSDTLGHEVHLETGEQKLTGMEALHYVRDRNDGRGDIGRIERTHHFLISLLTSAHEQVSLRKLPGLVSATIKAVETNMNPVMAVALATAVSGLKPEQIRTTYLEGRGEYKRSLWFWSVDEVGKAKVVREYITNVQAQEP